LANPEAPLSRTTLWYAGYGNVVNATDTYLFVATQDPTNWWQSSVQIVDITAPDGSMAPVWSLLTAGRVADKFKLSYTNDVFTSISEIWRWGRQRARLPGWRLSFARPTLARTRGNQQARTIGSWLWRTAARNAF
jgi:hypothetical protein